MEEDRAHEYETIIKLTEELDNLLFVLKVFYESVNQLHKRSKDWEGIAEQVNHLMKKLDPQHEGFLDFELFLDFLYSTVKKIEGKLAVNAGLLRDFNMEYCFIRQQRVAETFKTVLFLLSWDNLFLKGELRFATPEQ